MPRISSTYEISADPARLDVTRIHQWLSTDAYWALGRTLATQQAAIAGSLNFGAYDTTTGTQHAYARVITDRATFAWLCDVYVDPPARGHGLATHLLTAARDHLTPYGIRRVLLATADAHPLYATLGFTPLPDPEKWMILNPQ
jgi:GNAT superfamily N-acetyltransferase